MSDDSNLPESARASSQTSAPDEASLPDSAADNAVEGGAADSELNAEPAEADAPGQSRERPRRILIGSQRDPAAYRPKPKRDWIPVDETKPVVQGAEPEAAAGDSRVAAEADADVKDAAGADSQAGADSAAGAGAVAGAEAQAVGAEVTAAGAEAQAVAGAGVTAAADADAVAAAQAAARPESFQAAQETADDPAAAAVGPEELPPLDDVPSAGVSGGRRFPPPNMRGQLPPDLEAEFEQALGDASLEELVAETETVTRQPLLEPDSKHTGRVVAIGREDVFVELGSREQGILPLKQFPERPEVGAELQVRVARLNREHGLYELTLPQAARDIADWSELEEGIVVEARVTGHNTGGLECEVHHIRGFIPVSQISLYRVEDLDPFVGEKLACLVTEADPRRRNLVLSRRAVLEREQEEARKQLLESLEPGQVREGVVRKIVDFGAFVDLGGVDGLLHISQLSWGRVNHPREVLQEGQAIKVKVEKIDSASGRIGLAYRDMMPSPWEDVERKYAPATTVRGRVVKLMEFGAFVELEPGVEGLVHISELSHKRVWRVSDVVKEGEEIEVAVLSVDPQAHRISLSMRHLSPEPEGEEDKQKPRKPEESMPAGKGHQKRSEPLRGGLGKSSGGEKFGLKW